MKEIPYFRFTVSEWLNDDIADEDYETKGLFIDVCAYYWFKNCELTLQKLKKHFANAEQLLSKLISEKILKLDSENNVHISFLEVQWLKASELSSVRSKCAKSKHLQKKQKLNKSNAKAVQKDIYKDKDKDKDNINKHANSFANQLAGFRDDYPREMLKSFYDYWTEPNKSGTKMRFEMEKTWDLSKRLKRWASNNFGANKDQPSRTVPTFTPDRVPESELPGPKDFDDIKKQQKQLGL